MSTFREKFIHSLKHSKKMLVSVTALTLLTSTALGGTLAWQSISQTAENENQGVANPGARLHDYFDGKNKDVFVENFTKPEDGTPVFVRVKLKEYLEIGQGAGDPNAAGRKVQVIGTVNGAAPSISDKKTWITHKPGSLVGDDTAIHNYINWTEGGSTVYMPTFNMDKDSLAADINGTFAGPDNDKKPPNADRYQDYVQYTAAQDQAKPPKVVYEKTADEQLSGGATNPGQTHTAKETGTATVITMDEWKGMGSKPGNYWVYDADGWAYWAKPLAAGETTGCIINGYEFGVQPDDEWYYSIDVTMQAATAGDWGSKDQNDGFYKDGFTDDARDMMDNIAGIKPNATHITNNGGKIIYTTANEANKFDAKVIVQNPSGAAHETYVIYEFTGENAAEANQCLVGDTFTPTDKMIGKAYTLKATSNLKPELFTENKVVVLPKGANHDVVIGELDGKQYVDFGDNTYKEIKPDGSLADNFQCAGRDKVIGNGDDRRDVVVVDPSTEAYKKHGDKFLGPDGSGYYWAKGEDGLLGTEDDYAIKPGPGGWPNDILDKIVDELKLIKPTPETSTGIGKVKIKVGMANRFEAQVLQGGDPVPDQRVHWEILETDGLQPGTKMDANTGVLTVDPKEKIGKIIYVKGSSHLAPDQHIVVEATVSHLDYTDLPNVDVGSDAFVNIDGAYWYVVAQRGNQKLIFMKDALSDQTKEEFEQQAKIIKQVHVPTTVKYMGGYESPYNGINYKYSKMYTSENQMTFLPSGRDCVKDFGGEKYVETLTYPGMKITVPAGAAVRDTFVPRFEGNPNVSANYDCRYNGGNSVDMGKGSLYLMCWVTQGEDISGIQ